MSFFKKVGKAIGKVGKFVKKAVPTAIGAIGGFALGGPAGAVAGAGLGYQSGAQRRQLRKARQAEAENNRLQQEALNDARWVQDDQRKRAEAEAERLQREESDAIRSRRKRGRRSLLSEDEIGVPEMRRTLG